MPNLKIRLTPSDIANGMNVAAHNALRLAWDADHLFKLGSYASACSLAVLSIEETGKIWCLRGVACAQNNDELTRAWRAYWDHRSKSVAWSYVDSFLKNMKSF